MKILLVCPSQFELYGGLKAPDHPHIGLAYIAAVLEEAGHLVQMIDMDADGLTIDGFKKELMNFDPELVGITATTPIFKKAIEISETVKGCSSAFTMIGGIHPTMMPSETISEDSIDFVIKGEGERTVVELINCLESGGDLASVKGLCFKKNGKIIINDVRELISDLDSLPFPARHLFKNHKYTYPDALLSPTFPIVTSRGCPAKCTYCNTKNLHGRGFRYRSAQNVVDEIELLVEKFGAREIHIWDDNFTTNKNRVFDIRDEIIRRNIKVNVAFPNGLRVDYVSFEVLKALKEMGAYSIAFGVESGSQKILDNVKKGTSLKKAEEAFGLAKEAGLETWAFFMLGLPGEDASTIKETIAFAIKLNPDIAKFHVLKPYPGSEVYDDFLRQGLITDKNYEHYGIHTKPVHRLHSLSEDDILMWQKKAYRQFYFRPSKIANQIFRLKSWNRIKLNISTGFSMLKKVLC